MKSKTFIIQTNQISQLLEKRETPGNEFSKELTSLQPSPAAIPSEPPNHFLGRGRW